jgi:hypothetical protein
MTAARFDRIRALSLLLIAFVAGGAAGVAGDRAWANARVRSEQSRLPTPGHEAEFIPQPIEALGLSSNQEQQVRAISSRWRPKAAQVVAPLRTAVADLENGMFAEMMCVMTPNQRAKYLEELRGFHADPVVIAMRFRLVDAKQCPTTAVTR